MVDAELIRLFQLYEFHELSR